MILKTVFDKISDLEDIPFSKFYIRYVMAMQDRGIELEVRRIGSNVTISQIDDLLSEVYKEILK